MAGLTGIRFPGRYIQGPGAMDQLGRFSQDISPSALAIVDPFVDDLVQDQLDFATLRERHGGDCTDAEIARLAKLAQQAGCTQIIGLGGGKVVDTAKAVAEQLDLPTLIVPTIAASDAPCSALAVVYGEDGKVDRDLFLKRGPELVLVDTQMIANAPARFLAAGIGDALATWFEAESCRQSGAVNCLGLTGTGLAYMVARNCFDTISQHGPQAMLDCAADSVTSTLENVIEANILMSCIGFESGGVATAHVIHHGLCELDEVHHALHGEKVAIGVLAGLLMQDRKAEFKQILAFCDVIGLPTKLAHIGIDAPTDDMLSRVARRACRPGEITHNEPFPVTETMVRDALSALA